MKKILSTVSQTCKIINVDFKLMSGLFGKTLALVPGNIEARICPQNQLIFAPKSSFSLRCFWTNIVIITLIFLGFLIHISVLALICPKRIFLQTRYIFSSPTAITNRPWMSPPNAFRIARYGFGYGVANIPKYSQNALITFFLKVLSVLTLEHSRYGVYK